MAKKSRREVRENPNGEGLSLLVTWGRNPEERTLKETAALKMSQWLARQKRGMRQNVVIAMLAAMWKVWTERHLLLSADEIYDAIVSYNVKRGPERPLGFQNPTDDGGGEDAMVMINRIHELLMRGVAPGSVPTGYAAVLDDDDDDPVSDMVPVTDGSTGLSANRNFMNNLMSI